MKLVALFCTGGAPVLLSDCTKWPTRHFCSSDSKFTHGWICPNRKASDSKGKIQYSRRIKTYAIWSRNIVTIQLITKNTKH
jgi:hypothetical protein